MNVNEEKELQRI